MSIHRLLVSAVIASSVGSVAMLGLYRSAGPWGFMLALLGCVCACNVVAVYMAFTVAEEPEEEKDCP